MPYTLENLPFDNSFARLPEIFFSPLAPTPFDTPARLISGNAEVAALLGFDTQQLQRPEFIAYSTGQQPWPGSAPVAMLYAGHQFGHYVPQLGDGRAILLGEVRNDRGEKWDIQVKGSGLTPYSRQGDGRAVLRSSIREYLGSEAMHGLGIPTTRALALIGSDDEVYREQIEPGAMLLRVSPSHIRFGSFEVFYYRDHVEPIRLLADYVIAHHYPHLQTVADKYAALLDEIVQRTAKLIAQWQAAGFAHGVLNTDNMSILGLTLDYGPFGFMEQFDPGYICNHSDHHGRYAFDQQPNIGLWNLSCLAQALTPLLSVEAAKDCLSRYESMFIYEYYDRMRQKLGLKETDTETVELINDWLDLLQHNACDYTRSLRQLSRFVSQGPAAANRPIRDSFMQRERFDQWSARYAARLQRENSIDAQRQQHMNRLNPKYILRNYLAQTAIESAQRGDYSEIERLLQILRQPFAEQPEYEHYAAEPPDWAKTISVSCSS